MRLGDKDFKSGWEVRRKCRLIGGEDIKTPLANEDARGVMVIINN